MERGDIYLVALDPTSGREQQGKRPVLVVSPGKFNRMTGVPVVLPITSGGNFARMAGFAVSLMGTGLENDRYRSLRPAARPRLESSRGPQAGICPGFRDGRGSGAGDPDF
jgi:mRNA interferase ChpB